MKSTILALALLASVPAFATSTVRTIVRCQPAVLVPDAGLSVEVTSYTGPATIGHAPLITAKVTHFFLGHSPTQTFTNLKLTRPAPGVDGGSWEISGKDFELHMATDCLGLPNGIRSELVYESNGARNVEELACQIL